MSAGHSVAGFNGLDRILKRFFEYPLADGPDYEPEEPTPEVLAFPDNVHVNVRRAIAVFGEVVSVAGRPAPQIRVRRREDHVVRIGPVVVQAFPDAARPFRDIRLGVAAVMDSKVLVRAVTK